jgi:hypothetical protein
MHDDPFFPKKSGHAEKPADGNSAAELIHQVAATKGISHRHKICHAAVRVINKLPSVPGHKVREGFTEVGQSVDENTPPRLRNCLSCKRQFGLAQFMV